MNLKEIKQRIQSVKSTQKITSAMKLVSAAKLRRAQNVIENLRPYQKQLDDILSLFRGGDTPLYSAFSLQRPVKKVALVVVASNSTLCGGFNANIIRRAKEQIDEYKASGVAVELIPVGKKVSDALCKMGYEQNLSLCNQAAAVSYSVVEKVSSELMARFLAGDIDKVEILYTNFRSAAKLEPVSELFLPLDYRAAEVEKVEIKEFIVEPDKEQFVNKLLPKVVVVRLYAALLSSAAAEHAARMVAMQLATENAENLVTELVREYNKGRQQAITNELLDIFGGGGG